MKHLRRIRKTFVRQLGRNDCGLACIGMILKYSGRESEAASLRAVSTSGDLSLLELRSLAAASGLQSSCVEMDLDFLSSISKPCILHLSEETYGNHFQVCYGSINRHGKKHYLMGDPARGIHLIAEESLSRLWVSHAALYFEKLSDTPAPQARSSWHVLLSGDLIPTGLLVAIPLLSIFTAILGVAWSWALQRGIYRSIADQETHLIEGLIVLLFIVTLAKNALTYIRQQLMIRLNSAVNRHLMNNLIRKALGKDQIPGNVHEQTYFKNGISSLMKMQQAVSAFIVTILSDGAIVVLILAALFFQSYLSGLINTVYLILVTIFTVRAFPDLLFEHAHLNELSGSAERLILKDIEGLQHERSTDHPDLAFEYHEGNHSKYLEHAGKISSQMSRNGFVIDCLGTCSLICIFICGVLSLRDASLSYSAFMIMVIFSYVITALMPKICSALLVVLEGIDASRQYKVNPTL